MQYFTSHMGIQFHLDSYTCKIKQEHNNCLFYLPFCICTAQCATLSLVLKLLSLCTNGNEIIFQWQMRLVWKPPG